MNQQAKGTVMLVCGIVCLVSSIILIVLRCVTGEAYVKSKDMFMCLVWIALGVYFCYNGTSVTVDISVTFSPDTRFEAISRFQKELQEELSREIENCRVAVVIDGFNEKSDR